MVLLIDSVFSAEKNANKDWTFTFSLGLFHGPEYEWTDKAQTTASPNFEVVWKDKIFLNQDSLGIYYYENEFLSLNAIVAEGDERRENLDNSLTGLGDIDASTTLTLGAEFELGLFVTKTNLTLHSGGTGGVQAFIGLETGLPLGMLKGSMELSGIDSMEETDDLSFTGPVVIVGLSMDWANDEYTSAFFGVDEGQSARSGLPRYTANAGLKSVNLEFGVLYPVNESWSLLGLAGYTKFTGDAADSPVVKDDVNAFVGGFVNYHF